MTATDAKHLREGQTKLAVEPHPVLPQHNPWAVEPKYAFPFKSNPGRYQMDPAFVQTNSDLKWKVEADLGELDDHATMFREWDSPDYLKGKKKFSGWSNPLSWTDSGDDDDIVLAQTKAKLNFEESGFDTPADKGLDDDRVINFVQVAVHDDEDPDDINTVLQISNEDYARTPEKINIEHNARADTGMDDDSVL